MAPDKKKEMRRRAQKNLARRIEGNEKLLERLEAVVDVTESDGACSPDEIESALIEAQAGRGRA